MSNVRYLCDCDAAEPCGYSFPIPYKVLVEVRSKRHLIIVTGCPNGAKGDDILVRSENGYTIYKSAAQPLL